ncbi:hypothetical protein FE257_011957, partial [Aspergillus nanangensis]
MEFLSTDDNSKPVSAYSAPPPHMHPIPPSDRSHPPPSAPVIYEQPWRHHPPPFDAHTPDQRRASNTPQSALPPHGYPVLANRELPQLPENPYVRQGSLPGPAHTPSESHPPHPNFPPPMNGTPHEPTPHSAPPDFRARLAFPPQESHSNGDPPHTMAPGQYAATPVPHTSHTPAPYEPGYYSNAAYGMRQQRKAARAQQACDQCRARKAKCDEGRPACSHCKENNLICVYKEVPPHKQEKATQLILDRMQQLEDRLEEKMTQIQSMQVEHGTYLTQIRTNSGLRDAKVIINPEPPKQTLQHLLKPDPVELFQDTKVPSLETPSAIADQQDPNQ